jgi:hypothetical protein
LQKKRDLDARRAESHADKLEWEASLAVDYAIAAVEQAEVAVLDAVAGHMQATEARSASVKLLLKPPAPSVKWRGPLQRRRAEPLAPAIVQRHDARFEPCRDHELQAQ